VFQCGDALSCRLKGRVLVKRRLRAEIILMKLCNLIGVRLASVHSVFPRIKLAAFDIDLFLFPQCFFYSGSNLGSSILRLQRILPCVVCRPVNGVSGIDVKPSQENAVFLKAGQCGLLGAADFQEFKKIMNPP